MELDHLSPTERLALHQVLDKGWTTGRQKRIMALLRPQLDDGGNP